MGLRCSSGSQRKSGAAIAAYVAESLSQNPHAFLETQNRLLQTKVS
jgi:hypothetical protein